MMIVLHAKGMVGMLDIIHQNHIILMMVLVLIVQCKFSVMIVVEQEKLKSNYMDDSKILKIEEKITLRSIE